MERRLGLLALVLASLVATAGAFSSAGTGDEEHPPKPTIQKRSLVWDKNNILRL